MRVWAPEGNSSAGSPSLMAPSMRVPAVGCEYETGYVKRVRGTRNGTEIAGVAKGRKHNGALALAKRGIARIMTGNERCLAHYTLTAVFLGKLGKCRIGGKPYVKAASAFPFLCLYKGQNTPTHILVYPNKRYLTARIAKLVKKLDSITKKRPVFAAVFLILK